MMSSDMLAKPDFSKKVKYNGKQQEDPSDWKKCEVKTYHDAYESVEDTTGVQSPEQAPQTETCPKVQKRFCRCEQWRLLVLCTVLSAGSIILSSYMVVNNYNLQMEVKELKKHSEELMSTFSANNSRLQDEMQQLRDENEAYDGQWCPEGWRRFGSSCYYKSTERKTWADSRSFCQNKGSDLVVVNSKEEQKFVSTFHRKAESWIGLSAEWSSQKYEWKWVDGSPPTATFWEEGFSKGPEYYYDSVYLSTDGKWTRLNRGHNRNWICEK